MRNHNWTKYVTAVAHFKVSVGGSLRGVGVLEWRFMGGLRIQHPHSGLLNSYFLRGISFNVSVAAVARQPPAGRLLRLSRRSRSAQESTECRLSQCVP